MVLFLIIPVDPCQQIFSFRGNFSKNSINSQHYMYFFSSVQYRYNISEKKICLFRSLNFMFLSVDGIICFLPTSLEKNFWTRMHSAIDERLQSWFEKYLNGLGDFSTVSYRIRHKCISKIYWAFFLGGGGCKCDFCGAFSQVFRDVNIRARVIFVPGRRSRPSERTRLLGDKNNNVSVISERTVRNSTCDGRSKYVQDRFTLLNRQVENNCSRRTSYVLPH